MPHALANCPQRSGPVVAVLNQPVPLIRSTADTRRSAIHAADLVLAVQTLADADLIVFPEYSIQGSFDRVGTRSAPVDFERETLEILGHACRAADVWVAASLSEVSPRLGVEHQVVLFNQRGEIAARHAAGAADALSDPRIVDGPGGLTTALTFAVADRHPMADPGVWGAELVIQYWPDPDATSRQIVETARGLAWSNTSYVATANAAGSDGLNRWSGHSTLVNHDGSILSRCGSGEYELKHAEFGVDDVRRARRARTNVGRAVAASVRRCARRPSATTSAARAADKEHLDVR